MYLVVLLVSLRFLGLLDCTVATENLVNTVRPTMNQLGDTFQAADFDLYLSRLLLPLRFLGRLDNGVATHDLSEIALAALVQLGDTQVD